MMGVAWIGRALFCGTRDREKTGGVVGLKIKTGSFVTALVGIVLISI